jgi:hypothetical protein
MFTESRGNYGSGDGLLEGDVLDRSDEDRWGLEAV